MKQLAATLVCTLLCLYTVAAFPIGNTLLNNSMPLPTCVSHLNEVTQPAVQQKKPSYKKKMALKWLRKKTEVEQNKKTIKILGLLSFTGSLLGIAVFTIGGLSEIIPLVFIGLSFSLIAFILGIITLIKRSKLNNKDGTRRWPALIGIILGIGFIIGIGITILIMLS